MMNCASWSLKNALRFSSSHYTISKITMSSSSNFYVVLLLSLILAPFSCSAASWDYEGDKGVDQWPHLFPSCGGQMQSPVNITATHLDKNLPEIKFDNYTGKMNKPEIFNNGHTIQMKEEKSFSTISGGCLLSEVYKFEQLHFHWGAENDRGSEHLVDGRSYPMELHLVHRNVRYNKLDEALMKPDGLAVLGILFRVTEDDNEALYPITNNLDNIIYKMKNKKLDSKDLILDDLLPRNREKFVCYDGSLTTPTCNEAVKWTVFYQTVNIGKKQLKAFRKTRIGDSASSPFMVDNYRPVQDLNHRKLHLRDPDDGATINSVSSTLLVLSTLICWKMSHQ